MKCVMILLAIILIGVQEHEAAALENVDRSLFMQIPSVDLMRKALSDAFMQFENEYQISLKKTEDTYLKSLHDWLSVESYHYRALLRHVIDASHGDNQECEKGAEEIPKQFESLYNEAAHCIHNEHIRYSRKSVYEKLAKDMPQGFNVIQWIWYFIKFPVSGLSAYHEIQESMKEMEKKMEKCNTNALITVRRKIEDTLGKCNEENQIVGVTTKRTLLTTHY